MNNIIKRVWNQNRLVNIEDLTGMVFQAEDGGHTFEISGVDDTGAAVSISGTVSGSFIRPDNTTVALTGEASNGKAYLTLTDECYEVPGRFGLAVFVAADGKKTVVYSAIGTVARTSTGTVPSGTAATVEELLDAIDAAMQDLDDVAEQTAADAAAAQAAAEQIENMTVEAQTLAPGSSATVDKTIVDEVVHLLFGIPRGAPATVSSWNVKYQASASGSSVPTGTWLDNPPTVAPGSYLWSRTVVSYSDGTTTTSYSVSRMGIDGSGSVSSVNNVSPDGNGNVTLTPADIDAAGLDTSAKVVASQASSSLVSKTGSYTLSLSDAGKMILFNSSSAVSVTIPADANVSFPVETEIEIAQIGTGAVTVSGGTGVTVHSLDSAASLAGQYAVAALKKIGANEWLLAGALS